MQDHRPYLHDFSIAYALVPVVQDCCKHFDFYIEYLQIYIKGDCCSHSGRGHVSPPGNAFHACSQN